jgi:hypothetical protein
MVVVLETVQFPTRRTMIAAKSLVDEARVAAVQLATNFMLVTIPSTLGVLLYPVAIRRCTFVIRAMLAEPVSDVITSP